MLFFVIFRKYSRFLRKENLGRLLIVTFCILAIGTAGMILFEKGSAESNIKSSRDAIWWSFVTVTTVGYGDFYPTTIGGRVIVAMVMIFCIGFLGMFTATIASIFVETKLRQDKGVKALKDMTLWELREECRPSFEREEKERKERIRQFLQDLAPKGLPKGFN